MRRDAKTVIIPTRLPLRQHTSGTQRVGTKCMHINTTAIDNERCTEGSSHLAGALSSIKLLTVFTMSLFALFSADPSSRSARIRSPWAIDLRDPSANVSNRCSSLERVESFEMRKSGPPCSLSYRSAHFCSVHFTVHYSILVVFCGLRFVTDAKRNGPL